jgi:hypothetical protein
MMKQKINVLNHSVLHLGLEKIMYSPAVSFSVHFIEFVIDSIFRKCSCSVEVSVPDFE